jgi:hypothetical protein
MIQKYVNKGVNSLAKYYVIKIFSIFLIFLSFVCMISGHYVLGFLISMFAVWLMIISLFFIVGFIGNILKSNRGKKK